ncbi:amidohydrolase [Salinicola sp. DM10]|uniref:amidohydrolase family protein n=1 Tax=Salinicola sp. DM10 TaxID=2815721 RepID=UPI001A8FCDF0|nr:amidohydrolase family protein [Salinicola sp. DM10]MCE3026692.1 amidohydrolase family protein [Salinicola sp. DM10]
MNAPVRQAPYCDCHIHVFPREESSCAASSPRNAYAKAVYQPPRKDIADFATEGAVDGIGRAVLIQASIDGTDNRFLLETLQRARLAGNDHAAPLALRGVVMIDERSEGLAKMADAGVRAIRVQDRARLGHNDLARLPALAARAATQDWHVELNTEPERYAALEALLPSLPGGQALVLDHLGHVTPGASDALSGLYRLLDSGRVWIKLAPTRVSRHVGRYHDLSELVRQLAERYPERCVWGSDWPHVMTSPPLPTSRAMLDFLERVLTPTQRDACLTHNPATLYRF